MQTLLLTFHVIFAVVLVVSILLQSGKGADIGAVFGGAGAQTLFGARGPATFLNKMTIVVAVLFLSTSVVLAFHAKQASHQSVIDKANLEKTVPTAKPAEPATAPNTKEKPSQ